MEEFMAYQVNPWSRSEPVGKRRRPHGRACAAGLLLVALLVTAPLASSAQAASVPLGTAESFAVLAGTTVTNTGPSVISGDLGVSPGTAVTGFPPGTVTAGTVHAADSVALQAEGALATAYNDAAGRSSTATISADLAGRTLTPGVYTSASSLGLSGDLTLDAQGEPNAVFVFQAGSKLTVGSGSRVLLIGGAQACNVFWQVGSSATIGPSSAFAGNILALTSISLTTGATLNGRALARNGEVTLDTNTITKAACAAQTATPPVPTPPSVTALPSVTNISATTSAGKRVTVKLHGTDAAGAPLTYAIIKRPSHGTLGPINQRTGTVTYTPRSGFTGRDRFTYRVTSSNGTSNIATVTITVKRSAHQHTRPQPAHHKTPAFTG
jgi:Ice-binding-like/Bacterial Ig domain